MYVDAPCGWRCRAQRAGGHLSALSHWRYCKWVLSAATPRGARMYKITSTAPRGRSTYIRCELASLPLPITDEQAALTLRLKIARKSPVCYNNVCFSLAYVCNFNMLISCFGSEREDTKTHESEWALFWCHRLITYLVG